MQICLDEVALFWMSQWTACSPAWRILYHVTASRKGPIGSFIGFLYTSEFSRRAFFFLEELAFLHPMLQVNFVFFCHFELTFFCLMGSNSYDLETFIFLKRLMLTISISDKIGCVNLCLIYQYCISVE